MSTHEIQGETEEPTIEGLAITDAFQMPEMPQVELAAMRAIVRRASAPWLDEDQKFIYITPPQMAGEVASLSEEIFGKEMGGAVGRADSDRCGPHLALHNRTHGRGGTGLLEYGAGGNGESRAHA